MDQDSPFHRLFTITLDRFQVIDRLFAYLHLRLIIPLLL